MRDTRAAATLARRSFEMLTARRNAKPTAAAVTNEFLTPRALSPTRQDRGAACQ